MPSEKVPFTVVIETGEPFGPEVQVLRETAEGTSKAAARALRAWHNRDFEPSAEIMRLEDESARVLAVLRGHSETGLRRIPSGRLA